MTRRTVIFKDYKGNYYKTPEFNGDKEEFERFKMGDVCDANWNDIFKCFNQVASLSEFKCANKLAQSFFHSNICESGILQIYKFNPSEIIMSLMTDKYIIVISEM